MTSSSAPKRTACFVAAATSSTCTYGIQPLTFPFFAAMAANGAASRTNIVIAAGPSDAFQPRRFS
jgi:hypothetical protein